MERRQFLTDAAAVIAAGGLFILVDRSRNPSARPSIARARTQEITEELRSGEYLLYFPEYDFLQKTSRTVSPKEKPFSVTVSRTSGGIWFEGRLYNRRGALKPVDTLKKLINNPGNLAKAHSSRIYWKDGKFTQLVWDEKVVANFSPTS